jgi:hypothetical protein
VKVDATASEPAGQGAEEFLAFLEADEVVEKAHH